jgi:predicted nucleic-acid-binding Zn-ribbon protein
MQIHPKNQIESIRKEGGGFSKAFDWEKKKIHSITCRTSHLVEE